MSLIDTDTMVNFADGMVETLLLTPEKRKEFFNLIAYYANLYTKVEMVNGSSIYKILPAEIFTGQVINANATLINLIGETPEFKGFRKLNANVIGKEAAVLLSKGYIVRGSIGKNVYDPGAPASRTTVIYVRAVDATGKSVILEIDARDVVAINTEIDLELLSDLSVDGYANTNLLLVDDMVRTQAAIAAATTRQDALAKRTTSRRRA